MRNWSDIPQGTEDWKRARLGIATASSFHRILTEKRLTLSEKRLDYIREILACWVLDDPDLDFTGRGLALERGNQMEQEARDFFSLEHDWEILSGGFATREVGDGVFMSGTVGCSPDGRIVDDSGNVISGFELKNPYLHTHIGYLAERGSLTADYRLQVQGGLWVTGWPRWTIASYSPLLSKVVEIVEPDPAVFAALDSEIPKFCADLERMKEELAQYRVDRLHEMATA